MGKQIYPLTDAQHGIWLGQQIDLKSSMYNAGEYISLKGPLNIDLFKKAVRFVLGEATALNTGFSVFDGKPVQYFQSHGDFLECIDFSKEEDPVVCAKEWMSKNIAQCIDLANGPLFSSALIKLGTNDYYWYQCIHHIASDGYSFALLTQRAGELYRALLNNPKVALNTVGKGFGDYYQLLEIDEKYKTSPFFKKDQEFWVNLIKDQPTIASFTRSNAPIANRSIRQATTISTSLVEKMQVLATPHKATWSDFLMATVAGLLYQRLGSRDITLGIPVMGRMGTPALRIPGMVMNIVPLRIKIKGKDTFLNLMEEISGQIRLGRPHHRYRYEQLRRDLGKIGGSNKLFGPVVNVMPFDRSLEFGNCKATANNLSAGPVEDLSFGFVIQPDGDLRFYLDANPNRYSIETLKELEEEFLLLLSEFTTNYHKPLRVSAKDLSWIKGQEQKSSPAPVWEAILKQVKENPQAIAVQSGDVLWTYEYLEKVINIIALELLNSGLEVNDTVALALPRGEWAVAAMLAILSQGATFVFLDNDAPLKRNAAILDDAAPAFIMVDDYDNEIINFLSRKESSIVTIDNLKTKTRGVQTKDRFTNFELNPAAYLIYTSGSTGNPKGVVIGQKALAQFVDSAIEVYGFNRKDKVLLFAPMHFDTCIEEIFGALCSGAKLIIRNEKMLDSVADFMKQCSEWGISVLDLPTAYWHEIAFIGSTGGLQLPPNLRMVIIGGEAVQSERVKQWTEQFGRTTSLMNSYGPSEATVVATVADLSINNEKVSIGKPLPGREILVVDEDLQVVPKGVPGELILLGGGLANGYLNLPQQTKNAFINFEVDWLKEPQKGYRTGDRVLINEEGNIEYLGRIDDQIKISGQRIDPLEVEGHLVLLPYVQEAAVVVQSQENGLKSLIAHLSCSNSDKKDSLSDIAWLRKELAKSLPAAMLPSGVVVHNELPKNSTGKINRKKLSVVKSKTNNNEHFKLTPNEQKVADVWQQVLGKTNIKPNDDFFLLGGQSLQTIQVANRLTKKFKKEVAVTTVFQNPTVADLAEALSDAPGNENLTHKKESTINDKLNAMKADVNAFKACFELKFSNIEVDNCSNNKSVLLTGATGFVGAQLLHQLLQQTSKGVICLVRANSELAGREKLAKAFDDQKLSKNKLEKVKVILGNLEEENLGLSNNRIKELAGNISMVLHNAAITSVMRDYQSLKAANSLSTACLLELAAMAKVPFHLVSTIAVAPPSSVSPQLTEDFVNIHPGLLDGYQQSKWVSEEMVRIAYTNGLPVNIYRLGRVVGSQNHGYVNSKDLIWNILGIGLHHKLLPGLPIEEPWTPVDVVAKFMVNHVLEAKENGVFNLMPKTQVQLKEIYHWLEDSNYHFKVVPLNNWCEYLGTNGRGEDLSILGFFEQRQKMVEKGHQLEITPIQKEKFEQKAEEYRTVLPTIDFSLFKSYLNYAIKHNLVPAKTNSVSLNSVEA